MARRRALSFSDEILSYAANFAIASWHWRVPDDQALRGLMWSAFEGQVSAAIRLVPLGQTAGQRIMIGASEIIERCATRAALMDLHEIGNTATGLGIASAWHEMQYSRLFRS